jgi:hypothetical protein
MPLAPSSLLSSSSSAAPLEGDPSRKDDWEGGEGGGRRGGAPLPMAPSGAPGTPRGGHAGISSAAPHAPQCGYGGDCGGGGGGGGVRGCGGAVVGGGGFWRREDNGPAAQRLKKLNSGVKV